MMRYKILLGTLFILLVGTSCGGSSKDVENVQLESARDNNTQIQSTRPIVEGDRVSTSAADETILLNLQDTLVYTTDFKLHIWHLGVDEQPETIDFWVDGEQIYTDPHEEYVVFGGIKSNQFGLYRLDLETSSIDLIADIPNRSYAPDWSIISWSPDQNWFLVNAWNTGIPLGFVRADGSSETIQKLADNWKPTYWTTDNKLILTEIDDQLRATERRFFPIESVTQIDPATATREDLTPQLDIEFINNAQDYLEQSQRLAETLDMLDIELADSNWNLTPTVDEQTAWLGINYPAGFGEDEPTGTSLYCNTWQIGEWDLSLGADSEPVRIIYEFENAAGLTNLTRLNDGSILFIHISYPDCTYGIPQGQLIHMQPDGSHQIISENIVSAGDTSAFQGYLDGTRFVLSPNQQYVLWFHQGVNGLAEEKIVYITDLNTNASNALLVDGEPLQAIMRVLWIES